MQFLKIIVFVVEIKTKFVFFEEFQAKIREILWKCPQKFHFNLFQHTKCYQQRNFLRFSTFQSQNFRLTIESDDSTLPTLPAFILRVAAEVFEPTLWDSRRQLI